MIASDSVIGVGSGWWSVLVGFLLLFLQFFFQNSQMR